MSRKRTAVSGWESDEEDLLNDGGISAFKVEDELIDEEALLGFDDDGGAGEIKGQFGEGEGEMLEIGVDEDEIQDLGVEEDYDAGQSQHNAAPEEDSEQLDYNDDLPQADHVHLEYDDGAGSFSVSEADASQDLSHNEPPSEFSVSFSQEESHEQDKPALEETKESESESEDSDGEKRNRGRFKNERSNIISVGKAKSRTDIPDTLEVSAEQQAQLDKYPDSRRRDRGRNDHRGGRGGGGGGGRDQGRGGGFRGGRHNQRDFTPNRQGGGRMNDNNNNNNNRGGGAPFRGQQLQQQQVARFGVNPMGLPRPLAMIVQQQDMGLRHGGGGMPLNRGPQQAGLAFGAGILGPQPLMRMAQNAAGQRVMFQEVGGNRMLVPGQDGGRGGFGGGMVRGGARMPGGGRPPQLEVRLPMHPGGGSHPQGHLLHRNPQAQQQQHPHFRPGNPVSAASSRPHNIHINPNFRGQGSGGPRVTMGQPQSLMAQSPMSRMQGMGQGDGVMMGQDGPHPLLASQAQGFQHGSGMGQPLQQPRFGGPLSPGMHQMMGSPARHAATPSATFPGQRLPVQNQQQFSPRFNNNNNTSFGMRQQNTPTSPRFTSPQQGVFRGPSPQQQLQQQQQQRPLFTARGARRLGVQQQGTAPQKMSTANAAKRLSQQARMLQQNKAAGASPSASSSSISVLTTKRRSSEAAGLNTSAKVAKTTGQDVSHEPCDEELLQGLEQQKRLREMIKKRKEEARRKQAEIRRRDLEARLAREGKSLQELEGDMEEDGSSHPQPRGAAHAKPHAAQRITTVVSQGGQKQLVTKRQLHSQQKLQQPQQQQGQLQQQQQPQQLQQQQQQQQRQQKQQQQQQRQQQRRQQPQRQQQQEFSSHQQYEAQPSGQFAEPQYQQQQELQYQQPPPPVFAPQPQQVQSSPGAMFDGSAGFNQPQQQNQQLFQPQSQQLFQGNQAQAASLQQTISPVRQPTVTFKQQQQTYQQQQQQQQFQQQQPYQQQQQGYPPQEGFPPAASQQQYQQQQQQLQQQQLQQQQQQQQQQLQQQKLQQQKLQLQLKQQQQQQQQQQQPAPQQFNPAQHARTDGGQTILGRGRGGTQGMAMGQVASLPAQAVRGQAAARGRGGPAVRGGQVVRQAVGRGVTGLNLQGGGVTGLNLQGGGVKVAVPSNRTVLPVGRGRAMQQQQQQQQPVVVGVAGRAVVGRQVMFRPANGRPKVEMQKVSIDGVARGTPEAAIRNICEKSGPLKDIVMIESQGKAIVTFASKGHAVSFAQTWNSQPMNAEPVTITLLP